MGALSHIIDDGLLLNFDASSGYLPINLWNVLISFLAEKPWKSLSANMECRTKQKRDNNNLDGQNKILLLLGGLALPFDNEINIQIYSNNIHKLRQERSREQEAPWLTNQ